MKAPNGSDERKFLHDLASPVGAALFLVDIVIDGLQSRPDIDSKELRRTGEVYQSLEKVKLMLHERREILIKRGVPSAKT